ncbi:thioredoxin TrxC [soil metagenome]
MSGISICPACGAKNRTPIIGQGRVRCAKCHRDLPWLVDIADADFAVAVEASTLPVLVDVWAPWCGPCRAVAPVVEQVSRDFAGQLKVVKVNADLAPGVSARHSITSIPTFLFYTGGREAARTVGAPPGQQLRMWVEHQLLAPDHEKDPSGHMREQ